MARACHGKRDVANLRGWLAWTQMGHMRAHELRLRHDESTGETPQKRDLALPAALPAFRPDDEVIADFRRMGGAWRSG